MSAADSPSNGFDYIVVGSGAGGGTVAARLAEAGRTVLLLEAGGDPLSLAGTRLPEDYQVPAFHPFASENPAMRWDFFVRHYGDDQRQKKDSKFTAVRDGVLYPRAGALGGCTSHNAMILVYPHNQDWNDIADLTGDPSWRAENMRRYFERMEDCRHRPPYRWLKKIFGINPTRHGFGGWLTTERRDPRLALGDRDMMGMIKRSALKAFKEMGDPLTQVRWSIKSQHDPNDWRLVQSNSFGVRYTPLTTRDQARIGSRERILDVAKRYPRKLHIEPHALVTRVLFDENNRALGVEYLKGERLYRAHSDPSSESGETRQALASRETILCGGAFNTPQLLMLSGIGPGDDLQSHGIKVRVDLPSVGKNLQDRYEVSVVNRMAQDWDVLAGAKFDPSDPQYREWAADRKGVYATAGAALVVVKKSQRTRTVPDLFCLGLIGKFKGYFPGYSKLISAHHNYLSWVVLKAHTRNTAGTVSLRSADPRDTPEVNFRYFDEGSDTSGEDLDGVVEGIKFVRKMTAALKPEKIIAEEELPGHEVRSDGELRDYVRNNAWGHHASCTCPIGAKEKGGVLTSDFKVHGTKSLRVVDASVFPRIPGFFIVSAVYMIGEKAADVILADVNS
ncbi:MAG TPA: GMC family oxidoreductase [Candidatus Polarisedimenticolaceae bacterium]|nr:GMC family oxidoreductase [Candidatus Polarisedimenticolaceae bacterium]